MTDGKKQAVTAKKLHRIAQMHSSFRVYCKTASAEPPHCSAVAEPYMMEPAND